MTLEGHGLYVSAYVRWTNVTHYFACLTFLSSILSITSLNPPAPPNNYTPINRRERERGVSMLINWLNEQTEALEREHSCLFYMLSCQPSVFQPWSWPPPCLKLHPMPVIVHYFWQAYVAWSKSSALNGEQSFPTGVPKVDKLGSFCQGVTHFYFITPIFTVYFCLTLYMICIVFIYIYI